MLHPSNRKQRRLRAFLLFFPLMSLLAACISRYQEVLPDTLRIIWDPAIAIPLAKTSITLGDFLEQVDSTGLIGVGDQDVVTFYFEEAVSSSTASELYTINDQSITRTVEMPPAINLPFVIDTTITFSETFEADITPGQGERLDSVVLNTGNLATSLQIDYPANEGTIELLIPAVKQGNTDTLRQVFTWVSSGSTVFLSESSSLDGAVLDLANQEGTRNKFVFIANVTLRYRNTSVIGGSTADVRFDLTNLDWQGIYGDLRNRSIPTASGTVPFDVFGNINEGSFRLANPTMRLTVNNSFGIPIALDMSNITAVGRNGDSISMEGSVVTEPQILEAPQEPGESVESTILFDSTTSNLADMLAILPSQLAYDVNGTVNPETNDSTNFVLDNSIVSGALEVEVPLSGRISGITYTKDFEVSLDSVNLAIDSAAIRVNSTNTLPVDLDIQVYLVDELGTVLDSLFSDTRLIRAAPVDAQGFSQHDAVVAHALDITLDRSKLDALANTALLRLNVAVNTSEGGTVDVNLRATDGFEVQIGLSTKFQIETSVTLP